MKSKMHSFDHQNPDSVNDLKQTSIRLNDIGKNSLSSASNKSNINFMMFSRKRLRDNSKQDQFKKATWRKIYKDVQKEYFVNQFVGKLKSSIPLRKLPEEDEFFRHSLANEGERKEQYRVEGEKNWICLGMNNEIELILKIVFMVLVLFSASLKICFKKINSVDLAFEVLSILMLVLTAIEQLVILRGVSDRCKYLKCWILSWSRIQRKVVLVCLLISFLGLDEINVVTVIVLFREICWNVKSLKRIEIYLANYFNIALYWELTKIILFNFMIAHFLSIILNFIANDSARGWYELKDLSNQEWYEKYIWGYYWGTTIMLTIGFGDIYATNISQAIALIFIETFACIILAYNISEVSKLIQRLNQVDQQKSAKLKHLSNLCERNNIQGEFKQYLQHYIEKEVQQKYECCYREEERVIEQLPEKLQMDVKKEISRSIFQGLYFFKDLTRKTHALIAEKLNNLVAHPEQIILRQNQCWKVYILRVGAMSIIYRKNNCSNNGRQVQIFEVREKQNAQLLSSKFIGAEPIQGDLKAVSYSVYNEIDVQVLSRLLKQSNGLMFEYFCEMRDSYRDPLKRGIQKCVYCEIYMHDKFDCPKLHFIPSASRIIQRYQRTRACPYKQSRMGYFRMKSGVRTLKMFNQLLSQPFSLKEMTDLKGMFTARELQNFRQSIQFNRSSGSNGGQMMKKIEKCEQKINVIIEMLDSSKEDIEIDVGQEYRKYFSFFNFGNVSAQKKKAQRSFFGCS